MAVAESNYAGFECKFVEDPPSWLQTECPVCLHILRTPYQVTCCGKSFCKECIKQIKADKKACPCCKEDNYNDFHNKGLQQPLYGFKVFCVNKDEGCEWKGELGELDSHLNPKNLAIDNELQGCAFANIKCSYCCETLTRKDLQHHKKELCDKRPFSCEYCKRYESNYDDVIHNHWQVCGSYPVQCPNHCGAYPERQDAKKHFTSYCPLTVVECDFSYAGCVVRLARKDMPEHIKESLATHFSLLALSHKKQQEMIKTLTDEILALKHQTKEIVSQLQSTSELSCLNESQKKQHKEIETVKGNYEKLVLQECPVKKHSMPNILATTEHVPVDFVVHNPNHYNVGHPWISNPFYTHQNGYKLCMQFFFKETSTGFCLLCCLQKGEFDNQLRWPLKATVKLDIRTTYFIPNFELTINGVRPKDATSVQECGSISYWGLSKTSNVPRLTINIVSVKIKNT